MASNYNDLEALLTEDNLKKDEEKQQEDNESSESSESKEKSVKETPEAIPPPVVPVDDEVAKAKDKLYKDNINKLTKEIEDKNDEINNLKYSIKELNKERQLERESLLMQQSKSEADSEDKEEKKSDKKKKVQELSSKKKIAIVIVVAIFIIAVVVAVYIHRRNTVTSPTVEEVEPSEEGD